MGERLPALASDAFGISLAPRGTVRVRLAGAETWGLEWQTSAGVGTRSSDATALSEGEFAPYARVVATETGLAASARSGNDWDLDARISAFHTYVDRDLIFDSTRGRNVATGASSRLGAMAWARLEALRVLDVAASFAWTEAFLLPRGGQWYDWVSETRLPYVPRWVARVDAAYVQPIEVGGGERITIAAGAGLGVLGERPLPLGATSPPVALLDASLRVRWRIVEAGVQVQNLLDARYAQSVFHYASNFDPSARPSLVPETHFSAGAPLSVMATLAFLVDETAPLDGPRTLEDPNTTAERTAP
jgi:hypothetical protein